MIISVLAEQQAGTNAGDRTPRNIDRCCGAFADLTRATGWS
jgi:hypothetical protein